MKKHCTHKVVIIHEPSKIGRIIRIHCDTKATVEHILQVVLFHGTEDAKLHIGQGAHSQRDPSLYKSLYQVRILHAPDAMIDASNMQRIESSAYVGRRTLLPRVSHREESSLLPGAVEHTPELLGGIPQLIGVEAYRVYLVRVGQGLLQRRHGVVGGQIPEEAHDEPARDAVLRLPVDQGLVYPVHDRIEGHPSRRVGLRIEEDFYVSDVVPAGVLQVRRGKIVKVHFIEEHGAAFVVQIKKGRQVLEVIGTPQILHRLVPQL
mmetsp:Transcript_30587/g.56652  ORF Transcript_30587/g.56652 Transcript_30587/m.56652 type:complete len:263 (-) Transcript_30587:684-1472(-)